jgi:hypothetical protein
VRSRDRRPPTEERGANPIEVNDDGEPEKAATTPEWKAGNPQRVTIVDWMERRKE